MCSSDLSRMVFFDLARVFREEREALLKLPINESENKLLNEILKQEPFSLISCFKW